MFDPRRHAVRPDLADSRLADLLPEDHPVVDGALEQVREPVERVRGLALLEEPAKEGALRLCLPAQALAAMGRCRRHRCAVTVPHHAAPPWCAASLPVRPSVCLSICPLACPSVGVNILTTAS